MFLCLAPFPPPPPPPPPPHPTPVFPRHIDSKARLKRRNEKREKRAAAAKASGKVIPVGAEISFTYTRQMASYLRKSLLDRNVEAQHFVRCHQDACRDKLTSAIAAAQMAEMAELLDESGVDSGAE